MNNDEATEIKAAVQYGLRFLARRDHGEKELCDKIGRKHEPAICTAAVERIKEMGFIDDDTFAYNRASYLAGRGRSVMDISHRLTQLGVARHTVDSALAELNLNEKDIALQVVRKSYLRRLEQNEEEKVYMALQRRGFKNSDIRRAVAEAKEELENGANSL